MKPKILSFGEIIWDVYEKESFIGGAALNFAAHASKCGAESWLFSGVGNDELGEKAKETVEKLKVNSAFIKVTGKATGKCLVTLDEKGTPDFNVLENTAYDNIEVTKEDVLAINRLGFDALYFGTLIQRNSVSAASLRKLCRECSFKEVVCDINLRKKCYNADSVKLCLENATVLKLSIEEEPLLRELGLYTVNDDDFEGIASAISDKYPNIKFVILTLGEKGSYVFDTKAKNAFVQKAKKVKAVSTVGAGDSFIAAWITSYLSGNTPEESTLIANELSGFVVSKTDAVPDYSFKDGRIITYKLCDTHVHTYNSHDSSATLEDIVNACIDKNVSVLAVTDHCDIQYFVDRDMMSCIGNSVQDAVSAGEKADGKVKILKGVELGEGLWSKECTDKILSICDYDIIVGSVHAVRYKDYTMPYSTIDFSKMSWLDIEGYLNKYFDEVFEMLKSVPCNVMAHLTCPFRYLTHKYKIKAETEKYREKIEKIINYIIENSIAMEINTSGYGIESIGLSPDEWIIKLFKEKGGYLITLGSDAHVPENVSKGFDSVIKMLKEYGFEGYYYFENGKSVLCPF